MPKRITKFATSMDVDERRDIFMSNDNDQEDRHTKALMTKDAFKNYVQKRKLLEDEFKDVNSNKPLSNMFDAKVKAEKKIKEKRLVRESQPEAIERIKDNNSTYYERNKEKIKSYAKEKREIKRQVSQEDSSQIQPRNELRQSSLRESLFQNSLW